MTAVDTRRTVAARMVADLDAPGDDGPGCMLPLNPRDEGGPCPGYLFACPGCGQHSGLYLHPPDPGTPRWRVIGGAAERAEGLTLAPSIHHTAERGGCGWHGFLTNGVFVPC